jgi:hypothetical protein
MIFRVTASTHQKTSLASTNSGSSSGQSRNAGLPQSLSRTLLTLPQRARPAKLWQIGLSPGDPPRQQTNYQKSPAILPMKTRGEKGRTADTRKGTSPTEQSHLKTLPTRTRSRQDLTRGTNREDRGKLERRPRGEAQGALAVKEARTQTTREEATQHHRPARTRSPTATERGSQSGITADHQIANHDGAQIPTRALATPATPVHRADGPLGEGGPEGIPGSTEAQGGDEAVTAPKTSG